jgi:hypothetical protein
MFCPPAAAVGEAVRPPRAPVPRERLRQAKRLVLRGLLVGALARRPAVKPALQ